MTSPEEEQDWVPFAQGQVHCPECPALIPVPVLARIEKDEEGEQYMETRADMAEVWAHSWTHEQERGNHGPHQVGPDEGAP